MRKATRKQIEAAHYAAHCRKRKVRTSRNGITLEFSSLKEAGESLKIPSSSVCNSCKYGIKVKGLRFSYV